MKTKISGFYLSPDGEYVIEIVQYEKAKNIFCVVRRNGGFTNFLFDIFKQDVPVIFSSWSKLE